MGPQNYSSEGALYVVQLWLKVDIAIAYYSQTQYHRLQKATIITAKHPSSTNQQSFS